MKTKDEIIKVLKSNLQGYLPDAMPQQNCDNIYSSIADELLQDKQPDINQPFFGNSGAKPQASKSAEEIKESYHSITKSVCEGYQHEHILAAMKAYRNQPQVEIREILIKFAIQWNRKKYLSHITEEEIDEFLNLNLTSEIL
jgi:hypothetical protein